MLALGSLSFWTCAQKMEKYTLLTPVEFKKAIADSLVQLLDVRTAEEFASGHIAQAKNIDYKGADFSAKSQQQLDKSRVVALYCRSGMRSAAAAKLLTGLGYTVLDMKGGILAWPDKTVVD